MQQCSECGRQSNPGDHEQHFVGCVVWNQNGIGQAQAHRDFLAGFARPVKSGDWSSNNDRHADALVY